MRLDYDIMPFILWTTKHIGFVICEILINWFQMNLLDHHVPWNHLLNRILSELNSTHDLKRRVRVRHCICYFASRDARSKWMVMQPKVDVPGSSKWPKHFTIVYRVEPGSKTYSSSLYQVLYKNSAFSIIMHAGMII